MNKRQRKKFLKQVVAYIKWQRYHLFKEGEPCKEPHFNNRVIRKVISTYKEILKWEAKMRNFEGFDRETFMRDLPDDTVWDEPYPTEEYYTYRDAR